MEKKMIKKLVALLMIVTILATDFFVLGSNLITYAAQINSETNNSNIEFSTYFKDGENRVDSIEKSIKSEDLKLYAEIKVKNEGYFNGIIEIQNSNFNLKKDILSSAIASIEGNKVNLKQINAGDVVEIELGIEPIISDKMAVDMLSKTSTVKLTGTYMETTYEGLNIEAEKSVSINYQIDETAEAELQTYIITNKVLSLNGTNKRIIQLLVSSRLTENQYPVQQTKLNIHVPQLSETAPEEVNVMATGKLATNGETEISSDNWTNENGIVQIILNNEADANNEISWNKNICDELVVTFIYAEDVDASKVEITTDSEIKVHNSNNTYTATYTKGIENQEPNSVVIEKSEITTSEMYKGQLYANINATEKQDILYNTTNTLIMTNTDVVEEIVAHEGPDVFGTDESELKANTKYISTEINKEKMLQILGQDGNIAIQNGETTNLINKDSEVNENGNVVINYDSSATELNITTSKPVNAGILEIKHTKAITENSYTREQLETVKTLKAKSSIEGNIIVNNEKEKVVENSTEASIELKETISKAELTVSKENLSTTEANDVILGVKLITDGVQYDLYKNPTITIQLPAAVESVELNESPSKLYADEFEISSPGYNSENKTIEIALTGEQTIYSESSATQLYLQLNLKMTLSKLAPTQTDKITMTYTNENATLYDGNTTDAGVVEQSIGISAPTGLIKMFNVNSNENTSLTEAIIQKIEDKDAGKTVSFETVLVNNIGTDINNVRILGKLPTTGNIITGQDDENTFETTLTSIDAPNAEIYYTEKVDATTDVEDTTNGWTTNLADLTNAKLYLIKMNTLSNASEYTAHVGVQIPSTITKNETSYTEYQVIYDTDVQTDIQESSRTIGLTTSIVAGLEAELKAEVGQSILNNGDVVKEGEVIKYTATIKNEGTTTLENVEIKAQVPAGTVLVQPKEDYVYADGYYDEKDNTEMTATLNLEAGTAHILEYEVRVKTDITTGDEISNKVIVKYNNSEMESDEIKNSLEEANVRVTLKRADDEDISLIPGHLAKYRIYVENLSNENITNLKIKLNANGVNIQKAECIDEYNTIDLMGDMLSEIDIKEIPANGISSVGLTGEILEDTEKLEISATVVDSNGTTYRSNAYKQTFSNIDATITLSSPQNNAYVKNGDKVEYNIIAKNTGDVQQSFVISDDLSEYLIVESLAMNNQLILQTTNSANETTYQEFIGNEIARNVELQPGEEAKLTIIATVSCNMEASDSKTITITNKAEISCLDVKMDESEEVTHIIVENVEQPENIKNIISGYVWLDANNNQQKENTETTLNGITVKLYDNSTKNYVTDESGNVIQTLTDENGNYAFSKIKNGAYIIVFEYDMEKYEPTSNSRIKLQNLSIGEEKVSVAGTEVIDIQDNMTDINIGLKEKSSTPSTDDPENPENPSNPETPGNVGNAYSISGLAWLDANRDGDKDGGEITLSGIKVRLYNVSTENYLTDNNGNIVETTTNNNGEYKFNNIEKGAYIVLFEYDTENYEPTTYLVQGVDESNNSKAILKTITINGQELTLAVTDTINVQNNVSNINIGLKEKLIFDLELNKYISKVVVQNSKETKTYDYDNKTFGKVEIHRKQINGSLVVLEYTIKIKNNGEIAGYAKNIVDYLPNGLTFSSELNKDWYLSGNYLYTKGLENIEINPGEEKEIKLILTKTMTNENTGLINNRAEIYQDYNKYGEVDTDSTPNNQVQGEDDMGSVDIIIGPSTGGSNIANIILLIINLVLIGIVIKLMVKNEIIKIPSKKGRR